MLCSCASLCFSLLLSASLCIDFLCRYLLCRYSLSRDLLCRYLLCRDLFCRDLLSRASRCLCCRETQTPKQVASLCSKGNETRILILSVASMLLCLRSVSLQRPVRCSSALLCSSLHCRAAAQTQSRAELLHLCCISAASLQRDTQRDLFCISREMRI
jgi:hypothetical protein